MDINSLSTATGRVFSDAEKREAAHSMLGRILNLEKGPVPCKEQFRKELLHDLAAMNSMVPKGYGAKSSSDTLVYAVKQIACEAIARVWPDRCRYNQWSYSEHKSVLYIYADGRQYSFHVDLVGFTLPNASYDEWDKIEKGWSLSDEEYAREYRPKAIERADLRRRREYDDKLEINKRIRERRLKNYKAAKEYIRNRQDYERLVVLFWETLLSALPPIKRRNKCVVSKDLQKCLVRYRNIVKDKFSDDEMLLLEHIWFWGDYGRYYFECDESTRKRLYKIVSAIQDNSLSLDLLG